MKTKAALRLQQRELMRELRKRRALPKWKAALEPAVGPVIAAALAEVLATDWQPPRRRYRP